MTESSLTGLAVLMVEDEALLRRRLCAQLEKLGADVTGAGTLDAARRFAAELSFDYVLLDVNLPDGKGTDLLAEKVFGAAAVVVMSDTKAAELGIAPLARVVASAVSAVDPEIMGLGPVEAVKKALGRAGMSVDDIDLFEINEAFAAQVLPSARDLGIPMEKIRILQGDSDDIPEGGGTGGARKLVLRAIIQRHGQRRTCVL